MKRFELTSLPLEQGHSILLGQGLVHNLSLHKLICVEYTSLRVFWCGSQCQVLTFKKHFEYISVFSVVALPESLESNHFLRIAGLIRMHSE